MSAGSRARASGQYAEADPLLRAELRSAVSVAERVRALNELGLLDKETGRLDEARACYLEALSMVPPDSAEAATLWHNLGGVEHARDRFDAAQEPARRAVLIRARLVSDGDLELARDRAALAGVLVGLGRLDEAATLLERALDVFAHHAGADLDTAVALSNLAAIAHHRGQPEVAERGYRRALELKERVLGSGHPALAITDQCLAVVTGAPTAG